MNEPDAPAPMQNSSDGLILVSHLREAREAKGWTLRDLADRTRINQHVLASLEAGEFDVIEPPYVRAFLRGYARMVGVPVDEVNDAFPEPKALVEELPDDEDDRRIPVVPRSRIPWGKVYKTALAVIAVTALWAWQPWADSWPEPSELEAASAPVPEPAREAAPDTATLAIAAGDSTAAAAADSTEAEEPASTGEPVLREIPRPLPPPPVASRAPEHQSTLAIAATDSVWILIMRPDSSVVYEAIMTEGDRRQWTVRDTLSINLGRHAAVDMTVDGRTVAVPRIGSRRSTIFICTPSGQIRRR